MTSRPISDVASLPIAEALPALRDALARQMSVVLVAPPGAGKSTGIPLALLDAAWLAGGKILMLEPRRLAARAVAARMAELLGEPVGRTIGYRTRLDTRVGPATRVEVLTEGILTRMLQHDPALEQAAVVIFDEFHERSLQADLALALCLDARESLRPDLRILVMSATLDGEAVARLLGDAPIISAQGRSFPVEIRYREPRGPRSGAAGHRASDTERAACAAVLAALAEQEGDLLVFLPGQGEIRRVERLLRAAELPDTVLLTPLYGELAASEQDAALRPAAPGRRKVVLTTNVAETSLTIEGVTVVIDSGLVRRARFDPGSGMSRLETMRVSRASADQRCGRAGRLQSGVCHRLWTRAEQQALQARTPAEIVEADLAPLALELAAWGIADPARLRWLDAPSASRFAQARDLLAMLGALDGNGRITAHGRAMAELGIHPRLAHMLLRTRDEAGLSLALELAALLGERDLLRFRDGKRDADLRLRLEALHGHALPAGIEIDRAARERARRTIRALAQRLGRPTEKARGVPPDNEQAGSLLALAYPDRIAMTRGADGRYLLSGGRGAFLGDTQLLGRSEFLVVAELDAGDREARIHLAAPIDRATLEASFGAEIRDRERIDWDVRSACVSAVRERWLGALRLESQRLVAPDDERVLDAMIRGIRSLGLQALPWTRDALALRARLAFVAGIDPGGDWPVVDEEVLEQGLERWLGPWLVGITRRDQLARLDLGAALRALLSWEQQQRLDALAPTHLIVPSGSRIPVDYSGSQPMLSVRLQELFGLEESPRVGGGQVPVLIEMLSPARRPVQLTADLASFWARGYPEVKKELKGRYPKHYWPDDPRVAEPTARLRPRPR